MAAHDFNSPCDCRECREEHRSYECPGCGLETVVVVEMESVPNRDHKGMSGYEFREPARPKSALKCFDCGKGIAAVLYDRIDDDACLRGKARQAAIAAGNVCDECSAVEGHDSTFAASVVLRRRAGQRLCQDCLATAIEGATPDPSDGQTKYAFDRRSLKYVPARQKRTCIDCGRSSWVNIENQWKKQCMKCWKAARAV